eukprot:COSAG05_NODE_5333_length_1205_cov_1.356239_1_plen_51_part_00
MLHMDADGNGEIDLEEWIQGYGAYRSVKSQLDQLRVRLHLIRNERLEKCR